MDELSDLLFRCSELRNGLMQKDPAPGSRAALDFSELASLEGYPEATEQLIRCFDVWTVVTSDQLRGFATIIDSRQSAYAIYPIMRSVIEHSAWICWILYETKTPIQRVARANLALLDTAKRRIETASLIYGTDSDQKATAQEDYVGIKNDIKKTFNNVTLEPMSIEGETFPAPMDIVAHLGKILGDERLWSGVYKQLCGMANHPSLNVLEILKVGASGKHEFNVSRERMVQNVRQTIGPYLRSLLYMCAYMGWETEKLDRMYDEVVDE